MWVMKLETNRLFFLMFIEVYGVYALEDITASI